MEYITTLWQLLHTLDNNIFFQYSVYDNHIWLYIQTHPLACHLLQLILTVCNVILAHKTSMLLSTLASLTVCLCLSSSAHAWMSLTKSLHDYTSVCKCMSLNVCNACQCPVRVSLCVCLCVCVRVCSMRWQTDRSLKQGEKCAAWKYQSCSDTSHHFLLRANRLSWSTAVRPSGSSEFTSWSTKATRERLECFVKCHAILPFVFLIDADYVVKIVRSFVF